MNWIKKYWWIILILLVILFLLGTAIVNCTSMNRVIDTFLNWLNKLITPLGIVVGLVLGYPLLKRKLVETYITKQLEAISEANAILRQKCLELMNKYPPTHTSVCLEKEHFKELLDDYKKLWDFALKADIGAYKYYKLVLDSFCEFETIIEKSEFLPNAHYKKETVNILLFYHLRQIYHYASIVPFSDKVVRKTKLNNKLKKFVSENEYEIVENFDFQIRHKVNSAMLVTFFSITINSLNAANGLLLKCFYLSAQTHIPFVRIMFNKKIYVPPILIAKNEGSFGDKDELRLIGMKSRQRILYHEGTFDISKKENYYILIYADFSIRKFEFTKEMLLKSFMDGYLNFDYCALFDANKISDVVVENNIVQIEINTDLLKKQFKDNKGKILKQMKKDAKN